MDFLSLCRRLRQETGISNTGPSNVTGQTGDMLRLVDWIQEAWMRLQALHTDWNWMWREGTLSVSQGSSVLTLPTDLQRLDLETVRLVQGSESRSLSFVEYADLRDSLHTLVQANPTQFTIRPDGKLLLNAQADQAYTLEFEYFARPSELAESISSPGIAEEYQMIIVWSALMEYAIFDEAPELYQKGENNYTRILTELETRTLPHIQFAGPIA